MIQVPPSSIVLAASKLSPSSSVHVSPHAADQITSTRDKLWLKCPERLFHEPYVGLKERLDRHMAGPSGLTGGLRAEWTEPADGLAEALVRAGPILYNYTGRQLR